MSEKKFITRREGVELARAHGVPLSVRVNKDTMEGRGPKHAGKHGPTYLYTPEEFMRYAVERVLAATDADVIA
jgi:hypothetical protein